MKLRINLRVKKIRINLGWYPGEPFALFSLAILKHEGSSGLLDILDLQVGRFVVAIYYTW